MTHASGQSAGQTDTHSYSMTDIYTLQFQLQFKNHCDDVLDQHPLRWRDRPITTEINPINTHRRQRDLPQIDDDAQWSRPIGAEGMDYHRDLGNGTTHAMKALTRNTDLHTHGRPITRGHTMHATKGAGWLSAGGTQSTAAEWRDNNALARARIVP